MQIFLPFYWLRAWHWIIFCSSLICTWLSTLSDYGWGQNMDLSCMAPPFWDWPWVHEPLFFVEGEMTINSTAAFNLQGLTLLADAWGCWSLIFTPAYMIYSMQVHVHMLVAWLTWSVCSALWILFLFADYFFPLTVKLTFIVDHASSFHFVTPRRWTRYRSICYLWFKWSQFGADWLIIWKFIALRVKMDCFSHSQPLLLTIFSKINVTSKYKTPQNAI